MSTSSFRCSVASRDRAEDLAGTASTYRSFLLVEHAGPWGREAWSDARLPAGLGAQVSRLARATRVRALLARTGVRADRGGVRVIAAHTRPADPWVETTTLEAIEEVAALDLAGIGAGQRPGWDPVPRPVLAVCTHGRHDACCAERGRPLARSLRELDGVDSWEVSHIGGDRFAGNLLVLPHGYYYGGLDDDAGMQIAQAHLRGQVVLAHLRGRSSYPMPVQFAEIALRRHLGVTGVDAVRLRHRHRDGEVVHTEFESGDARWRVLVRTVPGQATHLTCRATVALSPPVHSLASIDRVA